MTVARTSTGTAVSGAAGITVLPGAGAAAGNFGLILVETANQTMAAPTGWTKVVEGAGTGTGGAAAATRLLVFSKNSIVSGDISTGVAIADSGDHQIAVFLTYSGVDTTTGVQASTEWVQASASTTGRTQGSTVTWTTDDIGLAVIGTDRDSATTSTNSGGTWLSAPSGTDNGFIVNVSTATGAGGGLIIDEYAFAAGTASSVLFTSTITSTIFTSFLLRIPAPSSGVTGTLAKTLDAVVVSSTAKLAIHATAAKTLGTLALSSTSKLAIQATLTKTLGTLTLSSVGGSTALHGTLAKTLDAVTSAGVGKLALKATVSKTLGTLTLSSASKLAITATLAKTLGTLTAASVAKLAIKGSTAKTLDTLVVSSAAKLKINGTLAKTLGTLSLSSVGGHGSLGTLTKTLASATLVSVGKLSIHATLNKTLDTLTGTETGQLRIAGTLSATLYPLSLDSVGHVPLPPVFGSGTTQLSGLILTSHGFSVISSLRRHGRLGEPINAYKEHKYIRNGRGYWTK